MLQRRRTIDIRVLFVWLTLIPLFLIGGVLGILAVGGRASILSLAVRHGHEVSARIGTHIERYLNEAQRINTTNANLIAGGFLDASDQSQLERYFRSQVQLFPYVSSIYFGNVDGGLVGSGTEADIVYITGTEGYKAGPFYKFSVDSDGLRRETLALVDDFDARQRAWFRAAIEAGDAAWASAYVLFTEQDMAIAASRPVYGTGGVLWGVLAVDLSLSHFSSYLRTIEVSDNGVAYVLDEDGTMLATSTDEHLYSPPNGGLPAQRLSALDSENPYIRASANHFLRRPYDSQTDGSWSERSGEIDRVEIDSEWCSVEISMIDATGAPRWFTVVVLPEHDFLAEPAHRHRIALMGVLFIAVAVLLVVIRVSWVITVPLVNLVDALHSFSGERLPAINRSSGITEIQELIRSFETMSRELHRTMGRLNEEILERRRTADRLEESVHEREALLRELNHRTKNNMNVISAMIRLQSAGIDDEATVQMLRELEGRIQSMALVHQKLYRSESLSEINLEEYLHDLVELLRRTNDTDGRSVEIVLDAEPIKVSIDIAVPCGLVINELFTNAMKHAFLDRASGRIFIELKTTENGTIELHVSDNGRGFPQDFDPRVQETLGLQMIFMIVEHQLRGEVEFRTDRGVHCSCTIPVEPQ